MSCFPWLPQRQNSHDGENKTKALGRKRSSSSKLVKPSKQELSIRNEHSVRNEHSAQEHSVRRESAHHEPSSGTVSPQRVSPKKPLGVGPPINEVVEVAEARAVSPHSQEGGERPHHRRTKSTPTTRASRVAPVLQHDRPMHMRTASRSVEFCFDDGMNESVEIDPFRRWRPTGSPVFVHPNAPAAQLNAAASHGHQRTRTCLASPTRSWVQ